MVGPNYIHVNDITSYVEGVFKVSQTPMTGRTEYYETHPVFVPVINSTRWERIGVNTYVDQGPSFQVPPEERLFMTWVQSGGIERIRSNGDTAAAWGHEESLAGVTMFRDGELLAFSVAMEGTTNSGQLEFFMTLNGIKQNGVGQTITITSGEKFKSLEFSIPIQFNKGDVMGCIVTGSSWNESDSRDCTLSSWYRDR
jgi:hypothetical protein